MDDRTAVGPRELRRKFARFAAGRYGASGALNAVSRAIKGRGWSAVVFGGVLRDLALGQRAGTPRDVDVVVQGVSVEELAEVFRGRLLRKTRFGGLSLAVNGYAVDIWPLESTWAFRQNSNREASFAELPRTTWLTLEAVAMDLLPSQRRQRRVYSSGFFESVRKGVLEVNLAENPFPALCVVRSLVISQKLNFAIGPSLARYICSTAGDVATAEMIEAQRSHYGRVVLGSAALEKLIGALTEREDPLSPLRLPRIGPVQLDLWELGDVLTQNDGRLKLE